MMCDENSNNESDTPLEVQSDAVVTSLRTTRRRRVITVARKEQNRIAQRLYRERQKSRRESRQKEGNPNGTRQLRPCRVPSEQIFEELVAEKLLPGVGQRLTTSEASWDTSHANLSNGSRANSTHWPCAPFNLDTSDFALRSDDRDALCIADYTLQTSSTFPLDVQLPVALGSLPEIYNQPRVSPSISQPTSTTPLSLNNIDNQLWDMSLLKPTSRESAETCALEDTPLSTCDLMALSLPVQRLGLGTDHEAGAYNVVSQRATNNIGITPETAMTVDTFSEPMADPYLNALQLTFTRTFTAFLHNAISLGFSLNELLRGGATDCQLHGFQSPFYRPDATTQSDASALIATALARHPSTPQHLRPTLPQILFPHHAFLDLLPFPALRARAITLCAAMPQTFDAMKLKVDIYVNQALVCNSEGGNRPSANIESGRRTESSENNQPWDMRSWKAAPWFLNKWRMLICGDEGEMWNPSSDS